MQESCCIFSNYWMRLSGMWRILQIYTVEGCYPLRLKVEVDNTLHDLQNSSYPEMKAKFNNWFIIYSINNLFKIFPCPWRSFTILVFVFLLIKKNRTSSIGFLGQQVSNLQQAALFDVILTSLVQYDKTFDVISSIWQSSFHIWSIAAGYGELCMWFQPIINKHTLSMGIYQLRYGANNYVFLSHKWASKDNQSFC